jgi:hypothetical protein
MQYRITGTDGRATFSVSYDRGEDVTAENVTMLGITPLVEDDDGEMSEYAPELIKFGMTPGGFRLVVSVEDEEHELIVTPHRDDAPQVTYLKR